MRSILGIICGLGIICRWGSFAVLTGKSSFIMKDIYYSNYKERVKKKLITKLQTTVITEGEKKGKALHTYNYLHSTIIAVERP